MLKWLKGPRREIEETTYSNGDFRVDETSPILSYHMGTIYIYLLSKRAFHLVNLYNLFPCKLNR
jgi:hypothetical protein